MFRHLTLFRPHCQQRAKYATKVKKRSKWKSVVGLEIHAQINTNSKLFSGASSNFGSAVNCNVSIFDAAIPGTLPVLNKSCVESGILTALALSCRVNPVSLFDRKHYFYADLPSGYQITQQRAPLASNGEIHFPVFTPGVHKEPYEKSSKLKQLQLEQDSGKSLHDEHSQMSFIDLNRAGAPLMELVFEPDLSDGEEAASLVKELVLILERINTCSCKMEEGALRVDANVSVNQEGAQLGTRTEVKNIGSIRGVANAVNFEIQRQIEVLEKGGEVVNETRAWDAVGSQTVPMRDKEVKQDYRFMPEPNLPPLRLNTSDRPIPGMIDVQKISNSIPELPEETRKKLKDNYNLSRDMIFSLVNNHDLLKLFMRLKQDRKERDAKTIAKIIINELMSYVNRDEISLGDERLDNIGEIIDLLHSGQISHATSRFVLDEVITGNPNTPTKIVEAQNLFQINDDATLNQICSEAMRNHPKMVEEYKRGKTKVFQALLNRIAKETNNRANMAKMAVILKEMMDRK